MSYITIKLYKTTGTRNYIFHFIIYTTLYCGGATLNFNISNI